LFPCFRIDNCVGANNHYSFFVAMVMFIFCGFYGSHLTMTTICTPEMFLDWFLYPNDCRFLYVDFQ
jgi:palmitoyltransferase